MYTSSPGNRQRVLRYGQQFPGLAPILSPLPPPIPKIVRERGEIAEEDVDDGVREAEVKIVAATLFSGASGRPHAKLTLSRGGAMKPLKSIIRKFPNSSSKIKANRPRSVRTRIGIRTPGRSRVGTPLVSPYKVLPAIPKTADKKIVTWEEDIYMSVLTGNLDCNPEQEPSRMVRVFIAGLYDDMEYERNYLFEHAYPELLSYCSDRSLEFKYVDLHLGVGGFEVIENCSPELVAYEISECQRLSHGPSYVLLIGETSGKELMPVFVDSVDLETLNQVIKKENIDPEDEVVGSYTKDENNIPPRAVLTPVLNIRINKENEDLSEVMGDIKTLVLSQWEEQEPKLVQRLKKTLKSAVEGNIMEDEKAQTFVRTELEMDVKQAILTYDKALEQCLCYERTAPQLLTVVYATTDKTHGGTEYGNTYGTRTTHGHTSKTMATKKTFTDLSPADRTTKMKMAVIEKVGLKNCGSFTTKATLKDEIENDTEYLQELTAKFVKDVKRMIDSAEEQTTMQEEATPLYQEALRHMRMCNRILDETVSNDESVLRVRHALFGNRDTANKPVVVYGGEECGKTCILAKVANYARFWMGPDCVTVMRFLNISSESSNSISLLRSIIDQITTVYGLEKPPDYPSRNSYKLGVQLRWILDIVARTCRNPLMLVIDGIDELDEPDEKKLSWFPNTTPGNDRVAIVTSVNSRQSKDILTDLANILNSEGSFIKLDDTLSEITAEETLNKFLEDHHRALTYTQKDFFIDTFQKIPSGLFLKIWLERARTWKSYEAPAGFNLPEAGDALEDILIAFFNKLEKTLGSAMAKYAAGYVTLSSHGLTEVELEDVLSCNNEVLQEVYHGITPPSTKVLRIPPLYVARFLHGLKSFLKEKYIDGIRVVTWMHQSFPSVYLTALPGVNAERIHADLAEMYQTETDVVKNIAFDNPPQLLENVKRLVRPQPLTAKNVRKLAALPYHMLLKTPEMGDELYAVKEHLFNNLKWLMTKIEAFTIDGVLEDLRMALDLKSDADTRELYDILRQAGPNIGGDPALLPMEVISRLKPRGSFEKLYNQCEEYIRDQDKAQLFPLYPCLPGTKEILLTSIPGCVKFVDALEDEGLVAMKGENGKVSVYSIETNEFTHHMDNLPDPGQNVISFISEDKQRMMSLIGNSLRVWNFKSGASIKEFEIENEDEDSSSTDDISYTCLDVTKDGATALLGTNKGGIAIVDTTFESVRRSANVHSGRIKQSFYTYDYKKIVTVGEEDDLIINVLFVKTLEVFKSITLPSKLINDQMCYLMEEERLICACAVYTIVIACLKTGDILFDLPIQNGLKMMTSMATDDDFVLALTGGEDDVLRIWDLAQGKLEKEIPVFAANCTCVAITDDGEYGGAAFDNPRVMKVYHLSSGDCLKEIKALRDRVTSLACVRYDHKMYLFSIFENKIADLWDLANMFSRPAESPTIQKLKAEDQFETDDMMLALDASPKPPKSPIPPKLTKIYPEASVDDVMVSMVMTSEGDHIITTSSNSRPKIWDVKTGLLVREIKAMATIKDIKPCVMDTAVVGMQELVNEYGTVYVLKMWDFQTGEALDLDSPEEIYMAAFSVSKDSMTAWIGNTAAIGPVIALSCFDLVEKRMLRHVVDDQHNLGFLDPLSISLKMHAAEVAPDGKIAITSSEDGNSNTYIHTVNLLDKSSPALRVACTGAKMADQLHVLTRNYEIITGTSKGEILIWNGFYFHILRTLTEEGKDNIVGMNYLKYWDSDKRSHNAPHSAKIMDIRLTSNERHLVVASKDKTITLWDFVCNSFLRRLVGHEDEVWCADVSSDTSLVISGSRDGSIRLWKFETGEVLSKFMVHIDVFDIRITKDNKRVVARGDKSLTGKLFVFEILNLEKALEAKPEPPVTRERTNMTLSRHSTNVSLKSIGSEELKEIS